MKKKLLPLGCFLPSLLCMLLVFKTDDQLLAGVLKGISLLLLLLTIKYLRQGGFTDNTPL
ncbi:hypothetical protein [Arsenicibacter rosenii]|uniref:Uncharacterized protein n=1 Tax=Arsenicibacter rosenii TaxID=1750698 RepID=A0A1S2VBI6_9BACT|nr:hypothetical protein [Arsenicibacter rosenii]OIN56052.1 hypothetical protein BLX24_26710 [Arsenicibacter rosenii]